MSKTSRSQHTRAVGPKQARPKRGAEDSPLAWLRLRLWHRVLLRLFWPATFFGLLYVIVFFFLNSHYFKTILEAQLTATLSGVVHIDSLHVAPDLETITVRGVQLCEPEGEEVIAVEQLRLRVPRWKLLSIYTRSQLELRDIELHGADVLLDFSEPGKFNLLRAVLPAEQSESEGGGEFTVNFDAISLTDSHVQLRFESFVLDFSGVSLDRLRLAVGSAGLFMNAAPSSLGAQGLQVQRGYASFDPAMFSFAFGAQGPSQQGLIMDARGGLAQQAMLVRRGAEALGRVAARQSTLRIEQVEALRALSGHAVWPPHARGQLQVDFRNLQVDDFWWREMSYGFYRLSGRASGAELALRQPWMNLSPSESDVRALAEKQGVELDPEQLDTFLFQGRLELDIPGNDPLVEYFFGPVDSEDLLSLRAEMSGSRHRAEGQIGLIAERFAIAGIELLLPQLSATLAGQELTIVDAFAQLFDGDVEASGLYRILDGDFDLVAQLGTPDPEQPSQLIRGIDLGLIGALPEALLGRLTGALHLSGNPDDLSLGFEQALRLELANPLGAGSELLLSQNDAELPALQYRNRVLRGLDGLSLRAGGDLVELYGDWAVFPDEERCTELKLSSNIDDLGSYLRSFGLRGVFAQRLQLDASVDGRFEAPTVNLELRSGRAGYRDYRLDSLWLVAQLSQGKVSVDRMLARAPYANVELKGWAALFKEGFLFDPDFAFDLRVDASDVLLQQLPVALAFPLQGRLDVQASVRGSLTKPKGSAHVELRDLILFGERFERVSSNVGIDGSLLSVDALLAELSSDDQLRPTLHVEQASYDLTHHRFQVQAELRELRLAHLQSFAALGLPLQAGVGFELSARGDLDDMMARRGGIWAEGRLDIEDISYAERALGALRLGFETKQHDGQELVAINGRIFDRLDVEGLIDFDQELQAHLRIAFSKLELLEEIPELAALANGHPSAHRETARVEAGKVLLSEAVISGAIEAKYTPEGLLATLHLSELSSRLFGQRIENDGELVLTFALNEQELRISRLQLRSDKSRLLLYGMLGLDGRLRLEIGAELDGALARFLPRVRNAEGQLTIATELRGRWLRDGSVDIKGLRPTGFVAVRRPIELWMQGIDPPLRLQSGLIALAEGSECEQEEALLCFKVQPSTPLTVELGGQTLQLQGQLANDGSVDLSLYGRLNASLARLAGDVVTDASGSLAVQVQARGNIMDALSQEDPNALQFSGELSVAEPIRVNVRELVDPIILSSGSILIAAEEDCQVSDGPCYLIPGERTLSGRVMGGAYAISGEIWRNPIIPEGGQIEISGNNLSFHLENEMALTFNPNLSLWVEDLRNFETYEISGSVQIEDARYYKDFDIQSELLEERVVGQVLDKRRRVAQYEQSIWKRMPQIGKIRLNVNVSADGGVRVDNQVAGAAVDLELGLQLAVQGTLKDLQPLGVVDVRNGSIDFRGTEFEIQPGAQLTFPGTVDARLDLAAQAEINTMRNFSSAIVGSSTVERKRIRTSELAASSQLYVLNVTLSGTLSKPVWDFDSRPHLSDNSIYTLILTGKTLEEFSASRNESPAMDIAIESILAPLFESEIDQILRAEQFKFLFSEGAAQLVFVQQVNRALRLAAGVSIRGAEGNEQAISGEYRFDDNWLLELTGQNTIEETGKAPVLRLGARVHWKIPLD
ncbi:MAG: translocation/assembly module TamB domain-containing protein [Myxococcota bacterium]|nr:translocation/assembly module TamB domain-containing protein [Myxococcota bacterium]